MTNFGDIINDQELKNRISSFLSQYGSDGLLEALDLYSDLHHPYVIKTKTSVIKIKICDINYITIQGHHMTIHTDDGIYRKYGSLARELEILSPYGFLKCNQNCIVSLYKIERILQNDIVLTDRTILHMSRNCTAKILIHFNRLSFSKK